MSHELRKAGTSPHQRMMERENTMRSLVIVVLTCLASLAPAAAQDTSQKNRLIGTWKLKLVENTLPDGSKVHPYGTDAQGLLMFDAGGHYALQIMSADRPKYAANDKNKGTADEYRATVVGSNCHFGRYEVNERDHTVTFHVEHATFTNWEGTTQILPFQIDGDEYTNKIRPTQGGTGVTAEVVWKRVPE
jgi:Lipocalin-like domain